MVMQKHKGLLARFESTLGLPPLSQMAGALDKFPDAKQLRLIKDVLASADAVSRTAPELDKVVMLIREINSIPVEKLEKLERLLKRVERIIKNAPQDLLEFLTSLKDE